MKHDDLADITASWLRANNRMTWTNFRYDIYGSGRPDVFSIVKTLHLKKCRPTVHEVKVSRADFFADAKAEKWCKYQPFAQAIYFVCPIGMVSRGETPEKAGLIYYDAATPHRYNRFCTIKRPRLNQKWDFKEEFLMRLLMGRWGTEPSLYAMTIQRSSA